MCCIYMLSKSRTVGQFFLSCVIETFLKRLDQLFYKMVVHYFYADIAYITTEFFPFKVYNSVAFCIVTKSFNNFHCLIPEHCNHLQNIPHSSH